MSALARYLQKQPDFKDPSSSSSPLPALYADLAAHKSSNRSSYEASVDWWARLLFDACLVGAQSTTASSSSKGKQNEARTADRLVLHLDQQLIEECTVDEVGRPLGLGTVAMELQSAKRLHPLNTFLSSTSRVSGPSTSRNRLSSTVYNIATVPLAWAFSQLSSSLGFGEGGDAEAGENDWKRARGDWVIWDNLEHLTEKVLAIHRSSPRLSPLESLYSVQTFERQLVVPALGQLGDASSLKATCATLDLQVLIKYMTRDKGIAVSDGKVIKLEHMMGDQLSPITEEERGIVNVKDTYSRLESQVEEIERRIKERQTKVETCLREKKREQAMSYLRSRKMLDELLEKRTKSLETLHGVLIKIEQAASDVEIVKAYELSTSSLKILLSDARLQPDRIDQSMEQMQETLASADEVRRAIEVGNGGIRAAAGEEEIDDAELEAEMNKLQVEVKEEQLDKDKKAAEVKLQQEKQQQQQSDSQLRKQDQQPSKEQGERQAILTQ